MCVIVYKPKDKKFPDYEELKSCWERNKDGAGYMFPYHNSVVIRKGFMKFADFIISLCEDVKMTGSDIPYVMHFRITTQGGVKPELTHPYPLSQNMDDLKLLNSKARIGVAHNGVISLTKSYTATDHNDTMEFVTDYLSLLIKRTDYWHNKDLLKVITKLCGSKLCLLDYKGHVEMIGSFEQDGDCYFSNLNHKPKPYTYYSSYTTTYTKKEEKKEVAKRDYSCCKDFNKDGRYNFIPGRYCPACCSDEKGYCGNCKYAEYCKKEGHYARFRS